MGWRETMTQKQKSATCCDAVASALAAREVGSGTPHSIGCVNAPRVVAECGCEIVGKRADGSPLPECGVMNFRYYGGRCKADEVSR